MTADAKNCVSTVPLIENSAKTSIVRCFQIRIYKT